MDPFTITPVPADRMIRIVMRGHWTVATVADYKRALIAVVGPLHAQVGAAPPIRALVDLRESGPQSQDVVAAYSGALGGSDLAPGLLATLISSALLKRQAERIAVPNQRYFTDEAEALTWLLSPDAPG